jgi:CheY-like chemotaxis protein
MPRILIVDDIPDSVDALGEYLRRNGYGVDCAKNGEEALTRIIKDKPDLVILDLYMPELDGISLLEILRSYLRLQSLPVIVLTGVADSSLAGRARQLRVSRVFMKGRATLAEIAGSVKAELHQIPN